MENPKKLPTEKGIELLNILKARFGKNMNRHKGLSWDKVEGKLLANYEKLWSLNEMERTGGEPDVIDYDQNTDEFIFYDCSAESPKGRRSLCFDREGLGIKILTEEQYRALQKLGNFDAKTSSWIETPAEIRNNGGALFADFRYDNVFIYHNGAQSYYAVRGFRGSLRV
jgi:hypothetical protein